MPRYLCYCPDYPDNLEKRLSVREAHLAMGQADKDSGAQLFGSPFLPQPGTTARENPPADVANGQKPNLAGSVMVYQLDSLEAMWDRLKRDPYWEAGVWDRERLTVEELYN